MKLLVCLIITFSFAFGNENYAGSSSSQVVNCPRSRHWNVTLQRRVLKSGFHRELSISVAIVSKIAGAMNNCRLLIKEQLPRDAFVDPYQVGQLKEPNVAYQIYVPRNVDLEAAAQDSNPQTVYIFVNASSFVERNKNSIIMPFHLRYQRAVFADQSGKYVKLYWENPTVLSKCEDQQLPDNCSHDTSAEFCGPDDHRDCQWIKYHEIQTGTSLNFEVPRGDLNDLLLVASITSIVVIAGCTYLIKTILRPYKSVHKSA